MRRWLVLVCLACLVPGAACKDEARGGRTAYNEAVLAVRNADWDRAQDLLLEARNLAGSDAELRFRAAMDLGFVHARQAEAAAEEHPEQALSSYRQAASWLRDAVKLSPEADDARANLDIVLTRALVLADRLNEQGGLGERLDRLLSDERGLRDAARELLTALREAGDEAAPVAFESQFAALATTQRTLLADAGTLLDLAGDELALLERKADEERSPEERGRMAQLQAVTVHVEAARAHMVKARAELRRLDVDAARRETEDALGELVRAREQLADPVTVLGALARGETQIMQTTAILAEATGGTITLGGGEPVALPPWLTAELTSEEQADLAQRLGLLLLRFRAVADSPAGADSGAAQDPKLVRLREASAEVLPFLEEGKQAMQRASEELRASQLGEAATSEKQALEALGRALERFADLRQLIELSYRDQSQAVAILGGEQTAVPEKERGARIEEIATSNRERMERLEGLIADELAALSAPPAQGHEAPTEEQLAQGQELYRLAEEERIGAAEALGRLSEVRGGRTEEALAEATDAQEHIENLRRLFFTLVQHLEELHREQTGTRDRTASAQAEVELPARSQALENAPEAQTEHTGKARALSRALAQQADQAAEASEPAAAEQAERLAQAQAEVDAAAGFMTTAEDLLATERAGTQTVDLEPAVDAQAEALARIAEAIRLLKPPEQNEQQQDQQEQQDQEQQQDQDQEQQQEQQEQQQEKLSEEQAERKLEEIREREAQRERERRKQRPSGPSPVEKDW